MSLLLQGQNPSGVVPPLKRPWLQITLAAWAASVSFSPLFIGSFTPEAGAAGGAVDNPPFGQKRWLSQVVGQWQPGPPEPYQRRETLVQPGIAADQPFGSGVSVIDLGDEDWPRQARRFVPQVVAAADNPPFAQRRAPLSLLWDAPTWDAQRREPLLVLVNDDPPFASRRPAPALAWEQVSWSAQQRSHYPQAFADAVNDPPFAQRRALPALFWEQVSWDAQRRDPLLVLVNDDPPFASRKAPAALAWEQLSWTAQTRQISPQTPAAPVNDPPFASRKAPAALAWEQPWWSAQARDPLLVIVNDDPPFASRKAPQALAWDAPSWSAQSRQVAPQTPAAPVNDPPFGSKRWLDRLIASWAQDVDVRQARQYSQQVEVASAPFERPWFSTVLASWEQPAQRLATNVKLPQGIERPFSWYQVGRTILDAWQPEQPATVRRRLISQGAPVNNPPFGAKPWKIAVVYAWQPGPPDILAPARFRQIPPPTEHFKGDSLARTYLLSPEWRWFNISAQDRTVTANPEDRTDAIPEQDRDLEI